MPALRPDVDPDGLLEYSVVYTDRALNHMSKRFVGAMQDILGTLKEVYHARTAVIVPGSGTFGMEAVARQFAGTGKAVIVRNGWFSYRWSQILAAGRIGEGEVVCPARPQGPGPQAPWAPCPADEVAATIRAERPVVVFAPHVETSSGMMLSDEYLRTVSAAAREVGALFVLDCIASGAMWVDMQAVGVDVLVSAPQKGWSSTPCGAMVMLGERARAAIDGTTSSSFACDLRKWMQIAEGYEQGQHAYHATMPTDALVTLRDTMVEMRGLGFAALRERQIALGAQVRALMAARGFPSVAAPGWEAPGVVVSFTTDPEIQSGRAFAAVGVQAAAGVPLQCGEGADFRTFRLGLFGLDKWADVDGAVARLSQALDRMGVAG